MQSPLQSQSVRSQSPRPYGSEGTLYFITPCQTPSSVCSQVTVVSLQAFLPESLPPVTVIPEDTLEVQLSWTAFLESKSRLLWNQYMATPSRELSLAPSTHPSSEGMKTRSSLLATTGSILACCWSFWGLNIDQKRSASGMLPPWRGVIPETVRTDLAGAPGSNWPVAHLPLVFHDKTWHESCFILQLWIQFLSLVAELLQLIQLCIFLICQSYYRNILKNFVLLQMLAGFCTKSKVSISFFLNPLSFNSFL